MDGFVPFLALVLLAGMAVAFAYVLVIFVMLLVDRSSS
jgi:hypothetical protein